MTICHCATFTHESGSLGCAHQIAVTETALPMTFVGRMCTHASQMQCDICAPPSPETKWLRTENARMQKLLEAHERVAEAARGANSFECGDPGCAQCTGCAIREALANLDASRVATPPRSDPEGSERR